VLCLAKIKIHAMGPLASLALRMAAELDHPIYDATYLALARSLGMPMVTADRRLVERVAAAGHAAFPETLLLS
jgi:predicted nucleic acid-binding protein